MGFGSYDESEQQEQNTDLDDNEAVSVHEHDHEGEVTFEDNADQDELLDRLQDMKSAPEE